MNERARLDPKLDQLLNEEERASLRTFIAMLPNIPSVRQLAFQMSNSSLTLCISVGNPTPQSEALKLQNYLYDLLEYPWALPPVVTHRDLFQDSKQKQINSDVELIAFWERPTEPVKVT